MSVRPHALHVLRVMPWVMALAFIAFSVRNGRQLQRDSPEIFLGAAPLVGENFRDGWDWRFSWALVAAGAIAATIVAAVASGWWWRVSMRTMCAMTSLAAGAFAILLALTDGRTGVLRGADHETEYLANLAITPPAGEFVRTFVDDIDRYSVHVRGHPPGFVLVLKLLDAVHLDGAWPVVALSVAGTMLLPLAVLVAVRTCFDDDTARRVGPMLVVAPYALWMMTSADAVYTAVGAWAVAALVVGVRSTGRRAVACGVAAGLLYGALLFMTYGGAMFVLVLGVAVAVAIRRSEPGVVRTILGGVFATGLVTMLFAGLGFWWFEGAQETRRQYWAGTAQFRPFGYFAIANLAVTLIAIGPVAFAGLLQLWRERRTQPMVWTLVAGGLLALLASHASQYSKAEVERIWLLFFPWIVIAGGVYVTRDRPRLASSLIGLQAAGAIALQAALVSKW
jgi:methylthioxylose transferase